MGYMRLALRWARRGYGTTSPNPMVGAVLVKGGRVKNPALVLEPQARRMTHVFDEEKEWFVTGKEGVKRSVDELEDDEAGDSEEEVEVTPKEEPYFIRDAAKRRAKKIPDIAKFL